MVHALCTRTRIRIVSSGALLDPQPYAPRPQRLILQSPSADLTRAPLSKPPGPLPRSQATYAHYFSEKAATVGLEREPQKARPL
ncbi:hypothetical protein C8Q79DRAFT_961206 [Trametes meyenii]|nr:hypothetical protein C8Q79DRAFT_961206 [Trametes meyenii]